MTTARYHVVPITNHTKFAVWDREATYMGQDGDMMFGDFVRQDGCQTKTFSTEAIAQRYIDSLNAL